ncbi:MAG: class I SAM-dependent methyltransferase [Desulfobacterales bacterium]|nr:class I SAM-dependent methyltransferase [Desulfobacterales bacterium]
MYQNKSPKNNFSNSKHYKYNTNNPISNYLVSKFYQKISQLTKEINFTSLVDVGCGEGVLLKYLSRDISKKLCCAIDYDLNETKDAIMNLHFCNVMRASIYEMPFDNNSFDLVICTEVLEHLENPDKAIEEIYRICNQYVLLSVPREPIWRLSNLARFSYLSDFGNTPGHINHWSGREFRRFVKKKFSLIKVSQPLPWTVILASI